MTETRAFNRNDPLPADWFAVVDTDVRFDVACIGVRRKGFVEIRPVTATDRRMIKQVGPFVEGSYWEVSAEPGLIVSREPFTAQQLIDLEVSS